MTVSAQVLLLSAQQALLSRLVLEAKADQDSLSRFGRLAFGSRAHKYSQIDYLEAAEEMQIDSGLAALEETVLGFLYAHSGNLKLLALLDDLTRMLQQVRVTDGLMLFWLYVVTNCLGKSEQALGHSSLLRELQHGFALGLLHTKSCGHARLQCRCIASKQASSPWRCVVIVVQRRRNDLCPSCKAGLQAQVRSSLSCITMHWSIGTRIQLASAMLRTCSRAVDALHVRLMPAISSHKVKLAGVTAGQECGSSKQCCPAA